MKLLHAPIDTAEEPTCTCGIIFETLTELDSHCVEKNEGMFIHLHVWPKGDETGKLLADIDFLYSDEYICMNESMSPHKTDFFQFISFDPRTGEEFELRISTQMVQKLTNMLLERSTGEQ